MVNLTTEVSYKRKTYSRRRLSLIALKVAREAINCKQKQQLDEDEFRHDPLAHCAETEGRLLEAADNSSAAVHWQRI
jgi:hypothetical protein